MPDARVSLSIGTVVFSAEGSEDWVQVHFDKVLERFGEAHKTDQAEARDEAKPKTPPSTGNSARNDLAINSIAAKLGAKSGADLVLAACFSLTRSNTESCSRTQILAEMKRATSYYKTTYCNNLSSYITRLIKDGKILERSTDSYALSASASTDLETKVA